MILPENVTNDQLNYSHSTSRVVDRSEIIRQLKVKLISLKQQIEVSKSRNGENHREVMALQAQIDYIENSFRENEDRLIKLYAKQEKDSLAEKIKSIKTQIDALNKLQSTP